MTEISDYHHEATSTPVIPLIGLSRLGLNTNGSMPQVVYGIKVEAEIYEHDGKAIESYWLKAVLNKDLKADRENLEFIAFSEDIGQIEELASSLTSAITFRDYRHDLSAGIIGYHSQAQIRFQEELPEDAIESLDGIVKSNDKGFALTLIKGKAHQNRFHTLENDPNMVVTSLYGEMDADGVRIASEAINDLRTWRNDQVEAITQRKSAEPSPSI